MILFIAENAGPANYLCEIIKKIDTDYIVLASEVSNKIFEKQGILTQSIFSQGFSSIKICVTGTCLGNCMDTLWIKKLHDNNIRVISVIEHWSHYFERFILDDKPIFPDYIFVNDEIAKSDSIKAGIPEFLLHVVGNPVLENLSVRALNPSDKNNWLESLGIGDKLVITFVSEIFRDDFSKDSQSYQGFDEYEVVEDILSVIGDDFHLLIKLHPAEKDDKYKEYNHLNNVTIVDNCNLDALFLHSWRIIGMGSMLLLEAALFRDDIISYRPNEKISFIGNRISATYMIKDKKHLKHAIHDEIKSRPGSYKKKFIGSSDRIISFIKEKANIKN